MPVLRKLAMSLALALALCLLACGKDADPADPRFGTPEGTVRTLLDTYGLIGVSEQEVQERMRQRGRFHLEDRQTYEACFADWRGPADEGLAGYVFGRIAPKKDHLTFTPVDDSQVNVFPEGGGRHIVLRKVGENWKVVLRESVPEEIRQQLEEVYRRAKQRETRGGSTAAVAEEQ